MAVYSKLSLSAGGGIISTTQQADQAENTVNILVGLGGTGIDCIRTIKTQMRSRLKPDDIKAIIPTYSHIRYIGVDTDKKSYGSKPANDSIEKDENEYALVQLDDTETFSISNPRLKDAIGNGIALKQRKEMAWFNWEKISAPDLSDAGAGGIRQIGRYMMMDKSKEFIGKLNSEIEAAKKNLDNPSINVHIFSGLSGGTGSGCFLDVCYMARYVASKVGGVTLFGYFFLPDVNLAHIPVEDTHSREFIPKNGYAAMQELDYCMQLQYNGGSFTQEYNDHIKIEWNTAPVDMCHLICATNASNDVLSDPYNYAMNVTSEYIMDFLTYSDTKFDLKSQLSNFRQKVNTANARKMIGAELSYCVIGAASANVPLREINTYLAAEVFNRFSRIGNNLPSKNDVEDIVIKALGKGAKNINGVYDTLVREVQEGARNDYVPFDQDYRFVINNGDERLVDSYVNQTADKYGRIETNGQSMVSDENTNSLINRIKEQLKTVILDINKGPLYSYKVISASEANNLVNIIDGMIEQNLVNLNHEEYNSKLMYEKYQEAREAFRNSANSFFNFFNNKKHKFNAYEEALRHYEQITLSVRKYEEMDKVLKKFKMQVIEISGTYYIKLKRVMETLLDTFRENRDALASERIMQSKDTFSIPMMTISEMKKTLDAEIEKIDIPNMMRAFMQLFIDNESDWILEDENKITKLVTNFFVENAFGEFANKTITSFLKDKYGIVNDERLTERIYEDWMKKLTHKASPLFYFNGNIWRETQASKLAFLSIPMSSAPIKAAAEKMNNLSSLWQVKESGLTDRIYVMCSAAALPLGAYNNCDDYERIYFSTTDIGRHYYEGKEVEGIEFNDWNKLPSLTPQSLIDVEKIPDILKKNVSDTRKLFDEADKYGIFDAECNICEPSKETMNEINNLMDKADMVINSISSLEDTYKADELLNKLSTYDNIHMVKTGMAMQNDGYAETEESKRNVLKDHFVSSPVYQLRVKDILKTVKNTKDKIDECKQKIAARLTRVNESGKELIDYLNALYTGVIGIEGRVVSYCKNTYGIEENTILSKMGDNFIYGSIPVYQGFLSYKKLSTEIKIEIRNSTNDRLNLNAPEVKETCEKLKKVISDDKVNAWVQMSANFENRAEIIDFLVNMKKNFETFCLGGF